MRVLRYVIRRLAASPGFTLVAAITLALAIGVNTSAFSVASAILLRPVDVPDIDSLYALFGAAPGKPLDIDEISAPDFQDFREAKSLEHVAAISWWDANITATGDPERVQGFRVSAGFFEAVGVRAQLGRTLRPADDREGESDVVVLSHKLWLRRFGADRRVIGTRLELNGRPHQIVGVMPKGLGVPRAVELWVPMAFTLQESANRGYLHLDAIARLKHGVSFAEADQEIKAIAARIAHQHSSSHQGRSARLALYRTVLPDGYTSRYSSIMFAASGFVLLIACVNLATLLFARGSRRQRERAVRPAPGATRGLDLIRRSLPARSSPTRSSPPEMERFLSGWWQLGVDCLVPAVQASRVNCVDGRHEGRRGRATSRRHSIVEALVVVEILLALVFLAGIALPLNRYPAPDQQASFLQRLLDNLRASAGGPSPSAQRQPGSARTSGRVMRLDPLHALRHE